MLPLTHATKEGLFQIWLNLSKNIENRDAISIYFDYFEIWEYLRDRGDSELLYFFSCNSIASNRFTNACKVLGKKELLLEFLVSVKNESRAIPVHVLFDHYQNWLWLAANESNRDLISKYLRDYNSFYKRMDALPKKRENLMLVDEYCFKAQVEENLTHLILNYPVPYQTISSKSEFYKREIYFHYHMQELLIHLKNNKGKVIDFDNLNIFLLNSQKNSGGLLVSDLMPFFISQGMTEEFFSALENMLGIIFEPQKKALPCGMVVYDIDWLKKSLKLMIPLIECIVRTGIILNKDRNILDAYIEKAESLLYRKYYYKKSESDLELSVMAPIKEDDNRINNVAVMIENIFNPTSFWLTEDSSCGESMVIDACNCMNPYSPKFSPSNALTLLENAIKKTPQDADIFIEYIRCKLLLDSNYTTKEDTFFKENFYKISKHYGFIWTVLSKRPIAYNDESEHINMLEKQIKKNVIQLSKAYKNAHNPAVRNDFPIQLFHNALGSPCELLELRAEMHGELNDKKIKKNFQTVTLNQRNVFFVDSICKVESDKERLLPLNNPKPI